MTAVVLLSDVICHWGKVSVSALGNDRDVRALLASDLLVEAGVVSSVVCVDCENADAAEVVFDDGEYGHYCPELGFIKLARQDIAAVEPNLSVLIEQLAETFEGVRRKTTPVLGKTWRIGAV